MPYNFKIDNYRLWVTQLTPFLFRNKIRDFTLVCCNTLVDLHKDIKAKYDSFWSPRIEYTTQQKPYGVMLSKLTGHAGITVQTGSKSRLAWYVYKTKGSTYVYKSPKDQNRMKYVYRKRDLSTNKDVIITATGISPQKEKDLKALVRKTIQQGKSYEIKK